MMGGIPDINVRKRTGVQRKKLHSGIFFAFACLWSRGKTAVFLEVNVKSID